MFVVLGGRFSSIYILKMDNIGAWFCQRIHRFVNMAKLGAVAHWEAGEYLEGESSGNHEDSERIEQS